MEEKKQEKKLSYEELNKVASDLHVQYQKLLAEYQKAMAMLQDRQFERESFVLQAMFRVMDHSSEYDLQFVRWCKETIQASMYSFREDTAAQNNEGKDEAK